MALGTVHHSIDPGVSTIHVGDDASIVVRRLEDDDDCDHFMLFSSYLLWVKKSELMRSRNEF